MTFTSFFFPFCPILLDQKKNPLFFNLPVHLVCRGLGGGGGQRTAECLVISKGNKYTSYFLCFNSKHIVIPLPRDRHITFDRPRSMVKIYL